MMVSFRNFQRIHLVGIGGIGMSGIAEVLLTLGYSARFEVVGGDVRLNGSKVGYQKKGKFLILPDVFRDFQVR